MLEDSKISLAKAPSEERALAEIVALRYLATELTENLIPAGEAVATTRAHKEAGDETWTRTVYGILLGLRDARSQGHKL